VKKCTCRFGPVSEIAVDIQTRGPAGTVDGCQRETTAKTVLGRGILGILFSRNKKSGDIDGDCINGLVEEATVHGKPSAQALLQSLNRLNKAAAKLWTH